MKSIVQRFWEKVDKRADDECWNWTGFCSGGYGVLRVTIAKNVSKAVLASTLSFEIANGKVPDGEVIRRRCGNRACVNPSHLFVGFEKILIERFDSMVKKTEGCWLWTGSKVANGYGEFWDGHKKVGAHRFSLEQKLGRPLESGLDCCHKCDNPSCVNPDHLYEGTRSRNILDSYERGRQPRRKPHTPLTPEKVLAIRAAKESGEPTGSVAIRFQTSRATVLHVFKRLTWSHV